MNAVLDHHLAMTPDVGERVGDRVSGWVAGWPAIARSLDTHGNAVLPGLLTAQQCNSLAALYPQEEGYRSRVVMAQHGFGRGE